MDFISANKILTEIFSEIDGFKISEEAIKKSSFYYIGMLYDEVTSESFFKIISILENTEGKTFIDLGSGVGKKVFLSAFCSGFSKCYGFEILTDVHSASIKALNNYNNAKSKIEMKIQKKHIEFFNNDFNEANLSAGDVFYLSMSKGAMEIELTGRLIHKLECCKTGTIVITTGLPIISPFYILQKHGKCMFTTGEGNVFYHERID